MENKFWPIKNQNYKISKKKKVKNNINNTDTF